MSGAFTVGGLVTGLDTNNIISQLVQLERQPITRLEDRITALEGERTSLRELRTTLLTLRNRAQDYRFTSVFDQFQTASSDETVLTAKISGTNPVVGSYTVNTTQLASATAAESSAVLGSAIDPNAALGSSGINTEISGGGFTINGVAFTVDPATQSLNTILTQINASTAGVTATYDAVADKITFVNSAPGDTSLINFGASDDDSNFLSVINIRNATQSTGAGGSTEATSTRNLGAIDPNEALNAVNFASGAMTSGTFRVNGITITVDAANDSLSDVLARINDSDAQVTASYDASTDTIRIVSETLGSRTIGLAAGTSNFLSATNLASAVQTAGKDSQFTLNGGPVQTRNSNEVSDAIGGITLSLLSLGQSTIAITTDEDGIVEDVQGFLTAFNDSVDKIQALVGPEGAVRGDASIRMIENALRSMVFAEVTGIGGTYSNLIQIGITTGSDFDSSTVAHLKLNEETFREALGKDRVNVKNLFSNLGQNGIADNIFQYTDESTRTNGYLNFRVRSNGTIDQQVQALKDRISRMEDRVKQHETRLRVQFSRLEQMSANFQSQGTALAGLSTGLRSF